MSKKNVAILCTLLLIFGVLLGVGSAYTFSQLSTLKDKLSSKGKEVIEEVLPEEDSADQTSIDEAQVEESQEEIAESTNDFPLQTPEDAYTTASAKEMDIPQIVEKCLPCVVAITNKGETEIRSMWGNFKQETNSSGSGVIIGQTDTELLILTNYHVIENNEELSVVFSWEENQETVDQRNIITAQVKDYDAAKDIAVIAIAMDSLEDVTIEHITVASIGSSDDLKLGQQVVAIGNALGYGQSVTTGIVSALNRGLGASDSEIGSANKYIQTDAAINPGNSGGALFNMNGELVGINSAKIATNTVEGMCYAIPISAIMENVEFMMSTETRTLLDESERGVLGISCIDVTPDIGKAYDMPIGVYISDTTPKAAADNAGLRKGDIITGLNGKTISDTTTLKQYLAYYSAGEKVTISYYRQSDDGYAKEQTVEVTLSPASVNKQQESNQDDDASEAQDAEEDEQTAPEKGTTPYDDLLDFFNSFGFGDFGFGH